MNDLGRIAGVCLIVCGLLALALSLGGCQCREFFDCVNRPYVPPR